MNTVLKNERGIALFMVFLLIMFSTLITLLMVEIAIINIKLNSNIAAYKKAVYAAEAGREYGRAFIVKNENEIPPSENEIELDNGSSFTIDIIGDDNDEEKFIIKSMGIYERSSKVYKTNIKLNSE